MPCDSSLRIAEEKVRLAEQGWSPEEIDLFEKEVTLAIEKEKAQAFAEGATLTAQQKRMAAAELEARKISHDRMHAKLDSMMESIKALGEARKMVYHE